MKPPVAIGISLGTLLWITPPPAHAQCAYTEKGAYVCILRVRVDPNYRHLKVVNGSVNGSPTNFIVDCSDFTVSFGQGWIKYPLGSIIHTACTEWSL